MIFLNITDSGNTNKTVFYHKDWFMVKGSNILHHSSNSTEEFVKIVTGTLSIDKIVTDDIITLNEPIEEYNIFISKIDDILEETIEEIEDSTIISSKLLYDEIVNDMQERYSMSKESAIKLANQNLSYIENRLWSTYSDTLQQLVKEYE